MIVVEASFGGILGLCRSLKEKGAAGIAYQD